jgi:16S rRNA (cytidine1402-2'-O)-methyltransferase
MPTLFVVATPIGNLEDVTLRALRVLAEVDLIAAEDTRTARKLLARHAIRARLLSYNDHNKSQRIPRILHALRDGDVALVSEGGTPVISDPGLDLVAAAAGAGFDVVPVPGPSAVTAALAVSGLPARQFTYLGFLPRRAGERRRLFASLRDDRRTLVAFESPRRLRASLQAMLDSLGDRPVAVCRELTKAFEEVFRGAISEALARFAEPRGEFTIVIAGAPPAASPSAHPEPVEGTALAEGRASSAPPAASPSAHPEALEGGALAEAAARAELKRRKAAGEPAKTAVPAVARAHNLPRRRAYQLWLDVD